MQTEFALHRLGWRAFQDLCIALSEERLNRPIQSFLPSNDAGRDGAFVGHWDDKSSAGDSTIQCKFTSKVEANLTLSMLSDELPKAAALAKRGLADDYIILTNHSITGASELKIRAAFEQAGVGKCRVFGKEWIAQRIDASPRLRMMVPRLYGLADLAAIIQDERAHKQAQMILTEMGDNMRTFVVTDAYRRSERAISKHGVVVLLGSPAAGKSTIGASLALGAADIWKAKVLKAVSPEALEPRLDPDGGQFVWIDDAWGSTQYQRDRTERWHQLFPHMQAALKKGTKFLITSRDYIWRTAIRELKTSSFPALNSSQVIIYTEKLTEAEKAQMLYNHIKFGNQPREFRRWIKPILPDLARRTDFLPESARRLGDTFFTAHIGRSEPTVHRFFERPKEFLEQTISNLAADSRAAIALVFLNGGHVRSPVSNGLLKLPADSFGVEVAAVKEQLSALNGSLLQLAEDNEGPYWTYRHPTVNDAFASYVAKDPELIELYLAGAKPETIVREIVCAGVKVSGAAVVVPNSLHDILFDRIAPLPASTLRSFISYRSNATFTKRLICGRTDIWSYISLLNPLGDDPDIRFFLKVFEQGLASEDWRQIFVRMVADATVDEADPSVIDNPEIAAVFSESELSALHDSIEEGVVSNFGDHISRLRSAWDSDYEPEAYFDDFDTAMGKFVGALSDRFADADALLANIKASVKYAARQLESDYVETPSTDSSPQQTTRTSDVLGDVFRDLDE